jgi:hypothetical protein
LCIKLDTHLPYDYDARSHKLQILLMSLIFVQPETCLLLRTLNIDFPC